MRLRPIEVYVFHHTGEQHDSLLCGVEDWTHIDQLKENILHLQKRCTFISLDEAYKHICYDRVRTQRYAVLTTDDGLRSTCELIPWLLKQQIPLTMFVNAKYLDGISYKELDGIRVKRVNPNANIMDVVKRQYITYDELFELKNPLITIALHGYEHLNAFDLSPEMFRTNVERCVEVLKPHPLYQPFMAYTWGAHNEKTDRILCEMNIVPVLVDGQKNYQDERCIHRICIDGMKL